MNRPSQRQIEPEIESVELDVEQLERALDQIEQTLGQETAQLFRTLLGAYQSLLKLIEQKNITLRWLRRVCFGSSEKTRDVVPSDESEQNKSDEAKADANEADQSGKEPDDEADDCNSSNDSSERPRLRGHGRLAADAYVGCFHIQVRHPSFEAGDACPNCQRGTLYRQRRWAKIVRLTGQPPVGGVVYEMERLRCGICGKIFTAPTPDEAAQQKYDPSVASVVGLLRYGLGMPFSRLEQWQQWSGVPFPASTGAPSGSGTGPRRR